MKAPDNIGSLERRILSPRSSRRCRSGFAKGHPSNQAALFAPGFYHSRVNYRLFASFSFGETTLVLALVDG